MAYDEALAGRIRALLSGRKGLSEKKMFGGMAFFLKGNMCAGVLGSELVMKVPRERDAELLARKGCRPFDFTGRPMRGFVMVASSMLRDEDELSDWLEPSVSAAAALPPKAAKPTRPAVKAAAKRPRSAPAAGRAASLRKTR